MSMLEGLRPETTWKPLGVPQSFAGLSGCVCFGAYVQRVQRDPLRAIVAVEDYRDAGNWLHVSVSRKAHLPSWADLVTARDELGYKDWLFVQLLPAARYWLNVHKYTMHLFSRLDRDAVPRALWDQDGADGSAYGQRR